MIVLVYLLTLAAIAGAIFLMEERDDRGWARPRGLLTWLISGNWPAKIGAILLLLGTGALLRYAALHVDVAPDAKLVSGVAIAAILGIVSTYVGRYPPQRTLSLVLAGSAFGVAYLTAYSAFALFDFVGNVTGVGLLVLTAAASGVFAVTRGALSMALLAMIGAYLAPAFGAEMPMPIVTYGYYAAATALTLFMVSLRGWRPLIHLSFLFTLAGGMFFAWTAQYYQPEYFAQMAPMLWVLVALHVALPIAERRAVTGPWIQTLDVIYLIALPLVSVALALVIAPSRADLSLLLIGLGFTWIVAAVYLRFVSRDGVTAHAVIGTLLMAIGVAARFRGLPWDVITLAFATGALTIGAYRTTSRRVHDLLVGLVLVAAAWHGVASLEAMTGIVFLNVAMLERLIAAALVVWAGVVCGRVGQPLERVLKYSGAGWAVVALISETVRWDVVSPMLAAHWILLALAIVSAIPGLRNRLNESVAVVLTLAISVTGLAAVGFAGAVPSWVTLFLAPIALLMFATRGGASDGAERILAVIAAPVAAAAWALHLSALPSDAAYVAIVGAGAAAILALVLGRLAPSRSAIWWSHLTPVFGFVFAVTVVGITSVHIDRGAWAILAEWTCLGGLLVLASTREDRDDETWFKPALVVALALVLQAQLLRWFGPAGSLTIADIGRMHWPTAISLLWVAMGAGLTIWARRLHSRALWIGGATLLIAAALKVVLIDFGSLGEIQNILAVIAAGVMFLLVGWLAPMPPREREEEAHA
jgi:hypothetical protein